MVHVCIKIGIHVRDHSVITLTSKVTLRQLKNFKKVKFILDLQMKDWELITTCDITSDVWDIWKELLFNN